VAWPYGNAERDEYAIRAATEIFGQHGEFIRNIIQFQVHDPGQVEDLYQEFFLALVRRPLPANVRNVRSYLYRALIHDMVDLTRRNEKYQQHLKKHAEEIRISINNDVPEDALLEAEEIRSVLAYLTRRLTPREAQVVTLRFRENYEISDIASELGVNRRTVSRYLCAGMGKIRRLLGIE